MANSLLLPLMAKLSLILVLLPLVPARAVASHRYAAGSCPAVGRVPGKYGHCKILNRANCCKGGETYPQYRCSPRVTFRTPATMTLNSFARGAMGSTGPCACDKKYHNDGERVVALSTGWYNGGKRCGKNIRISANGKTVVAKVRQQCCGCFYGGVEGVGDPWRITVRSHLVGCLMEHKNDQCSTNASCSLVGPLVELGSTMLPIEEQTSQ